MSVPTRTWIEFAYMKWMRFAHDWGLFPHANLVRDSIWLGDAVAAWSPDFIHANNIKLIVNMTAHVPCINLDGVEVYQVPMEDVPNLPFFEWLMRPTVDKTLRIFHAERQAVVSKMREYVSRGDGVLVHCFAGKQRSATMLGLYLHDAHPTEYPDAASIIAFIRSKRVVAFRPMVHFIDELIA